MCEDNERDEKKRKKKVQTKENGGDMYKPTNGTGVYTACTMLLLALLI